MGEFSRQLLEVNGDTGDTYRLTAKGEGGFDMGDLDDVRHYAIWRGHLAVTGGLQSKLGGDVGFIKLKPGLSADEVLEIKDAGFGIESGPILH